MTLRGKTLCLVGTSIVALLLVLYAFTRLVVLNNFTRAEYEDAQLDIRTGKGILNRSTSEFGKTLQGYAGWDDTFKFAQSLNPTYSKKNYYPEALRLTDVDFAFIVTREGKMVGLGSQKPAELKGQLGAIGPHLSRGSSLLQFLGPRDVNSAIVALPAGPTLVATAPIIPSNFSNHVRGALVFARVLTPQRISRLTRAMNHKVVLRALPGPSSNTSRQIMVSFEGTRGPLERQIVISSTLLPDENGRPHFVLEVCQPRDFLAQGVQTVNTFAIVLTVAGLLFTGLALWFVEVLVLRRLAVLSRDVDRVRESSDLSRRVRQKGSDELALLGRNINTTLAALENAQSARLEGEARLRESERLHREMAQVALTAGDAFFVAQLAAVGNNAQESDWLGSSLDWKGQWTPCHAATGQTPATLHEWIECVEESDQATLRAVLERVVKGEEFEIEVTLSRENGSELYWLHRGTLLRGEGGEGDRILGACLDITERKKAERNLAHSEERLARVLQTVAEPIWIFDREGHLSFANPDAALRVFGSEAPHMEGTRLSEARWKLETLDGAAIAADDTLFERVREANAPLLEQEFSLEATPGQRVALSVGASPLLDDNQEFAGVVASVSDITERRALQDRLVYQAFHDPLTGLANRQLLRNRLDHALSYRTLEAGQLAVVFLDLDNFKVVNDSVGHEAGDALLQTIAERLRRVLRAEDTAARQGGDEFVVLLESLDTPRHALEVTGRILEALREPIWLQGHSVVTPPSLGVAFYEEGTSADELLRRADAAMYEAKRRGKGRVHVWDDALSGASTARLQLEDELRHGLTNDEFSVFYQPKIDLESGQMRSVEALLRWNHPVRGLMSPPDFIPVAEEMGLIVPLGLWVLREACTQGAQWNAEGASDSSKGLNVVSSQLRPPVVSRSVPLNVNISARQLTNGDLAAHVAQILQETGLAPECLILEITETVLMDEVDSALKTLHELRALGVKLSIDDFGVGYSSLAYLRHFPFDYLKIDRQFVSRLYETPEQRAIVSSMIHLGHALGLEIVAEGTEEWAEVQQLREFGCDLAQGHILGRPVPPQDLQRVLQTTSDRFAQHGFGAD